MNDFIPIMEESILFKQWSNMIHMVNRNGRLSKLRVNC